YDVVDVVELDVQLDSLAALIDSLMTPFHNVKPHSIDQVTYRAEIAHQLYQKLILPVERKVRLPEKLLVVSDAMLTNLPFEMLMSAPPASPAYLPTAEPVYLSQLLLQRYSFAYAPSTSFLGKNFEAIKIRGKMLVIANAVDDYVVEPLPDFYLHASNNQFSPLPFADREAQAIKKIVKTATVIRRNRATKNKFFDEASTQNIIHLATHGFVDQIFDAFSSIVFAVSDDSLDNGLLSGYEISDLDLNCSLIALSACETGRGKAVAGEGVLGLPRLFLGAGARTVLMTLWQVDDKFTSELMPNFYKNLLQQQNSMQDALTNAKREIVNQKNGKYYYQHPFFWAAFCLYGYPSLPVEKNDWYQLWFPVSALIIASLVFGLLIIKRFKNKQ
ncbi:MAG TPA: CHAT domain-containing protein, partial [bacterium]|nr:CHAT domain-containing protein [bacterium]